LKIIRLARATPHYQAFIREVSEKSQLEKISTQTHTHTQLLTRISRTHLIFHLKAPDIKKKFKGIFFGNFPSFFYRDILFLCATATAHRKKIHFNAQTAFLDFLAAADMDVCARLVCDLKERERKFLRVVWRNILPPSTNGDIPCSTFSFPFSIQTRL
jgi:hypothetical protein